MLHSNVASFMYYSWLVALLRENEMIQNFIMQLEGEILPSADTIETIFVCNAIVLIKCVALKVWDCYCSKHMAVPRCNRDSGADLLLLLTREPLVLGAVSYFYHS